MGVDLAREHLEVHAALPFLVGVQPHALLVDVDGARLGRPLVLDHALAAEDGPQQGPCDAARCLQRHVGHVADAVRVPEVLLHRALDAARLPLLSALDDRAQQLRGEVIFSVEMKVG